jgi:hypothetical protein
MASIHKCASTSLRAMDLFCDFRSHADAQTIPMRVAWLRHPIRRMHSAWRGFHIRTAQENWRWGLAEEDCATWERFVDFTFKHKNDHWNPQIPQLTFEGRYMPTVTERMENITYHFNDYLPGPLPMENISPEIDVNLNYRRGDLEDRFKEDLDLWESL